MTIITSDTHGEFQHIEKFCKNYSTTKDDILIILGDAGINYYGRKRDAALKRRLVKLPITIFCIHGNHEQRPETIPTYNESLWNNGTVYIEPYYPNIIFAKDGEIYDIDGLRCIAIGGAYSIDKARRIESIGYWWPDEQPSDAVKQYVEQCLDNRNWTVDVVFTHTTPLRYIPRDSYLTGFKFKNVDKSTEEWLNTIEDRLNYKRWYCGHYHVDKIIDKIRFVFWSFVELRPQDCEYSHI